MASISYTGKESASQEILVEESLYETLYRFQEARYELRPHAPRQVRDALDWIESRQDPRTQQLAFQRTDLDRQLTGGYRTESGEYVRSTHLKLPTGEGKWNLAVQFIRLLLNWEDPDAEIVHLARASFLDLYPGPHVKPGRFCCGPCNASFQPALHLVDAERYAAQEPAFIETLRRDRADRPRWKQHPFYCTILALDDIGTDAAHQELHYIAPHIHPSLATRYQSKDDRASRFRRLAIETALKYV